MSAVESVVAEVLGAVSRVLGPLVRAVRVAEAIARRGMQALEVSTSAQHSALVLGWSLIVVGLLYLLEGWLRLVLLLFVGLLVLEAYGMLD